MEFNRLEIWSRYGWALAPLSLHGLKCLNIFDVLKNYEDKRNKIVIFRYFPSQIFIDFVLTLKISSGENKTIADISRFMAREMRASGDESFPEGAVNDFR